MKNTLNYYYGIDALNIHQKDKTFYFKYENKEYIFVECDIVNIEQIYNLSIKLNQIGIPCHKIIENKSNQILTKLNNVNYILMEIYMPKEKISSNDIINFNNITYFDNYNLKIDNWYNLWTEKVDYLEYQISQIGKKYPLMRKSLSYYIGLSENAITLIRSIPNENLFYALSHRRINYNDTIQELYNPLNFIVDIRIRDICEYFKNSFFNKKEIESELFAFLDTNNLNYNESCYFLARMLFPTYYFDMYEKIINNEIDEIKINNIIQLSFDYEKLIKKLYFYLKNKVNIPTLEWLTS